MKRLMLPDVFDIPGPSVDPGPSRWAVIIAVGAIAIGAALILVAASEDRISAAPQVTIGN
jgi:hypothetical protein